MLTITSDCSGSWDTSVATSSIVPAVAATSAHGRSITPKSHQQKKQNVRGTSTARTNAFERNSHVFQFLYLSDPSQAQTLLSSLRYHL